MYNFHYFFYIQVFFIIIPFHYIFLNFFMFFKKVIVCSISQFSTFIYYQH